MGSEAYYDIICDKLSSNRQTLSNTRKINGRLLYSTSKEIAENFRFHQRRQRGGGSIQEFITALQKLTINCKFGSYLLRN